MHPSINNAITKLEALREDKPLLTPWAVFTVE